MNALKPILIVDDCPRDAELTQEALAAYRVLNETVVLRDGREALDYLLRRGPFDGRTGGDPAMVLLDLKMPRMDGMEALRQIKANPALRAIPVVVMTASRAEQDLLNSFSLGVDAYVLKPVQFHELIEALRRLDGGWRFFPTAPQNRSEFLSLPDID